MSTCMEHGWQHEQDRCPVCHPEPNYKKMCFQWQSSAMDLAVQLADVEKKMKKMEAVVETVKTYHEEFIHCGFSSPYDHHLVRDNMFKAIAAMESDG